MHEAPSRMAPPPPPIILLVEDDADTREMYHLALVSDGYAVVDAPDATDALSSAADVQPDLIVTDLGLPRGGVGVTFVRGLRQNPRTAGIPVVAVTGLDPRMLGAAAELFDSVLMKPVTPDNLIARIRQSLAGVPKGGRSQ